MRRQTAILVGAAGVLVSGYIHFYLYFEGGYRGIAPESFAGLTISRAFALNAVGGLVLAELLVASLSWSRLRGPAVLGGIGFAASTLLAYSLARTTGLLGFKDDKTINEALIAVAAEIVALVALGSELVRGRFWDPRPRSAPESAS